MRLSMSECEADFNSRNLEAEASHRPVRAQGGIRMNLKLEAIVVPVSDVDHALA
jgi:hypothetical protein